MFYEVSWFLFSPVSQDLQNPRIRGSEGLPRVLDALLLPFHEEPVTSWKTAKSGQGETDGREHFTPSFLTPKGTLLLPKGGSRKQLP